MAKSDTVSKHGLSTNNFIALAVLATLVVVIICSLIGRQLLANLLLNNRVIAKKNVANNQLKRNLEAIVTLQSNYSALGSKTQLIEDALPTTSDFDSVVSSFEVLAGTSGVRLKSITPSVLGGVAAPVNSSTGSVQPYDFSLSVEGSYDNLLRFFTSIELSSRPVKVTTISQSGPSSSQLAQVQLQTYYQAAADLSPKTELVK